MSTSPVAFVPSASVTLQTNVGPPGTFAMPAVDSGNVDTMVTADGSTTAYVSFAAGVPVAPGPSGEPGGQAWHVGAAATLAAAIITAGSNFKKWPTAEEAVAVFREVLALLAP